jgi:hypothetical protein
MHAHLGQKYVWPPPLSTSPSAELQNNLVYENSDKNLEQSTKHYSFSLLMDIAIRISSNPMNCRS